MINQLLHLILNLLNNMKRIKSVSDKRLILKVKINNKDANLLVDTGAVVGILNEDQSKKYDLKYGAKYQGTLQGIGGELNNVYVCNTFAEIEDRKIPQFLIADISNIVKAIKKETGVDILGIVSLSQMKIANLSIDCNDMEIIVE